MSWNLRKVRERCKSAKSVDDLIVLLLDELNYWASQVFRWITTNYLPKLSSALVGQHEETVALIQLQGDSMN